MNKILVFKNYFLIFLQGIFIACYDPLQGASHKELIDLFCNGYLTFTLGA